MSFFGFKSKTIVITPLKITLDKKSPIPVP